MHGKPDEIKTIGPILASASGYLKFTSSLTSSLPGLYEAVSTSHKAQTIGRTSHLYALRPLVHSASYRPGRDEVKLDVNFK